MLFSDRPRTHYTNSQLREVICQIRFPAILSIGAKEPADFQEAVRHVFPRYAVKQDQPPVKVTVTNGVPHVEKPAPVTNYHFVSADNKWKLNLTRDFISLSTLNYDSWEDFGKMLDRPLAEFIRIYQPAFFQRIGLRYSNLFSRQKLDLEGEPWNELIEPPYLGILSQEDVVEQRCNQCNTQFDVALDNSCRVKVLAGPAKIKPAPNMPADNELKFVLDMDLYMGGEISPMLAAGALETLHGHSTTIFEGAITDKMRCALR